MYINMVRKNEKNANTAKKNIIGAAGPGSLKSKGLKHRHRAWQETATATFSLIQLGQNE